MQIELSGHHLDITDGIREAIDNKFNKVSHHFPEVSDVDITLTVERAIQSVEATTRLLGETIAVNAQDKDLYKAIGQAAKKLEAALAHRKGVVKNNRHRKPADLNQPQEVG